MTTMNLKNGLAIFLLGLGFAANAQTADEISTAIEKEDYGTARKMCQQLIAKDAKSSEGYFFMGETYYENEKADSAQYYYTKGLAANDNAALCLIGQGKLLLDQGKTAEAQKNFEKAAKWTRNKNAYIQYQIAKAYLDVNFGASYKSNTSIYANQAIEWLDKAIATNPKDGNFFSLLGDAYAFKKEAGTALTKYEFATDKNKKDPKNYVKRARINKSAKVFKNAEEDLNKCLEFDPNYPPALKELTEVYVSSGQYSKVAPILQRYTDLIKAAGKTDFEARERLVRYLCYYAKDYKTVITEANDILAASPKSVTMYRWLAWAYAYQGKDKEKDKDKAATAIEDFKKGAENAKIFLEKKGDTKVIVSDYDNYMQCAFKMKDFETASKLSKEVLALDSTRTDVYETIAKGYYDAGQYDKAVAAYDTKIAKTKATTTDYFYMGQSYMSLKNYPSAEIAFGKLTDMSPAYLFAWTQRAKIAEIGDPELTTGAARIFHEKIVELAKADETKNKAQLIKSNYFLGLCNAFVTKDYPKSLAYLNEVIRLDPANADAATAIASVQANIAVPVGNK